ncbi:MAG: hypothetical protein A2854_03140 [Parcubacteria group bacterium RIFCSPHIGHO2_01_FULL_56_18]|nr:MAG: hypothetical protein A2854_03140 [Parcubacteria group bacterium RIFCSPHIGHO2_01_FULL_56_18]
MDNPQITQQQPGAGQAGSQTQEPAAPISQLFNPNSTLIDLFNAVFFFAIAVGAILAVLRLGYAGIIYMTTDLWHSKQNAKEIISQAVLGILLLLAVYLILFQINPDILNLDILRSTQQ